MSRAPTEARSRGAAPRDHRGPFAARVVLLAAAAAGLSAAPAAGQEHHASAESCTPPGCTDGRTLLGDVVPVGEGTARSWVHVDGEGRPAAVGVTLTEAALNGLAADATPGMIWAAEYVLALPRGVAGLPFDHVGLNWNPRGHMPGGIYDVPHFDFHFYTIGPEERRRITARGADLDRIRVAPATGRVPAGYVFAPDSEEPGMGGHWIDPVSHEFHGRGFTTTFIYGTYDGEVIFYEPMITRAFLRTRPDVTLPVKVPQRYAREGHYPTRYRVRYDPARREYTVALEGLTPRTADGAPGRAARRSATAVPGTPRDP